MDSSIYVTRRGTQGPKVVMVHGSAQGSSVGGDHHFTAQEPLGAQGWQLIVPDRPGHGRSPSPGRPDDAEADGAWVAELLGDGAHLVGHSFGGCVALAAATRRPEAVRSLTLIEPAMHQLAIRDASVRRFLFQMIFASRFPMRAASRATWAARALRIPENLRGGKSHEELTAMGRGLARLRVPARATIEREIGEITRRGIPLLVVTGGWSRAFDVTGDVVCALGKGRRLVIASPHHFPQLVRDEFNRALVAFMTEAEAKR